MTVSPTASDPWRWRLALFLYRLSAPFLLGIALPAWLRKMVARDGWKTPFGERFGFYHDDQEWGLCGQLHVHAVSVGETLIALKFLRSWCAKHSQPVALAVSTATAYHVAIAARWDKLTVVYAPIDLSLIVYRYLQRFQPSQLVLVEAEAWPELMQQCQHHRIPVCMINARLSARSEKRYRALRSWIAPLFTKIACFGVQGKEDAERFTSIGIPAARLQVTGSIKFDPQSAEPPIKREEFAVILAPIQQGRSIVLAASTHDGEELLLARSLRHSGYLFVCVPRHAERRHDVRQSLQAQGYSVWLRSDGIPPQQNLDVLIIDSTGELKDWTAHADFVIIGKSFLSTGGQNPTEAILARKPLMVGPHMENFEPLISQLLAAVAAVRVIDCAEIPAILHQWQAQPATIEAMSQRALDVLQEHAGATERSIALVESHMLEKPVIAPTIR